MLALLRPWRGRPLVVSLWLTALALSPGCGGDGKGGGAVAGDGGLDAGAGGEGAGAGGRATGGSGASTGDVGIPPPAPSDCAGLGYVYRSAACTSPCGAVNCDCDPFSRSLIACHPDFGCLTAIDCEKACELDMEEVLDCAATYVSCSVDGDCKNGRCARTAGAQEGACLADAQRIVGP